MAVGRVRAVIERSPRDRVSDVHRDMEAVYGSPKMQTDPGPDYETYGSCVTPKLVKWKGDWSKFKKLFRAAAARDGVTEALATGERIAKWSINNMTEGTDVAYCIQQYAFCTVSVLQNRI